MPAGLDEAAGIYTFIFSAIQLTKFLITYAADVENAHDDLQKLLQNLEYMLEVIQELDEILRKNVKTKAIRESDLLAAEICRTNAVSVVKQLQALKKRAGAASGNEKEEMTLLRRMVWPMFKPRLKEMSQEVNDTRNLFYNVRKVYNSAPRWKKGANQVLYQCMELKDRLEKRLEAAKRQAVTATPKRRFRSRCRWTPLVRAVKSTN